MERKSNLFFALCALCVANKDGFTVDARTLEPVTKGYAVAVKATQDSHGITGAYNVVNYVMSHKEVHVFGGWYDDETGRYYIDASMIFSNLEKAITFARLNRQKALYDLNNGKEIRL